MNCKGGVGKTVTTINMAAELAARGKRVVVVDADPQCNLTYFYNFGGGEGITTLYEVLTGNHEPYYGDWILDAAQNIRLVPGSMDLVLADVHALQGREIRLSAIRELAEVLAEDDAADFMLIDTPPSFTAATTAGLAAADDVIIPMKLDAFSLSGVGELMRQIAAMQDVNPALRVSGVLVTQFDGTTVALETVEALRQSAVPIFNAMIHRATAVDRSTFEHKPLRDSSGSYAQRVADDYKALVDEYLKGGAENG
jgi:chromosome partitioning protein